MVRANVPGQQEARNRGDHKGQTIKLGQNERQDKSIKEHWRLRIVAFDLRESSLL